MFLDADEDFPHPALAALRQYGHDVLSAQEDGRSGVKDVDLLARGHTLGRVLLTHNRRHFERLHREGHSHSGIVSCTRDDDSLLLASRIDQAIMSLAPGSWCLRVNRQV